MKKAYSTPDILFDSFALSQNIAAACAQNVNTQYTGVCGVPFGNKMVFTMNTSGCRVKVEDGSPVFNYLCYHIPVDQSRLFNS